MCVLLFVCTTGLSAKPDQKLTIRNHRGTLSEFFKQIEKQSDYRFFYNDELVNIEKEVHQLDVNNKSIDEVLNSLLANTGLKYRKLDNNLIVISSLELLQNVSISGVVVDASGEPVIGVNVSVKGTTNGTITDVNGSFSLNVSDNNAVIAFSFIGYTTQEIKVGSQRTLRIVLLEDNLQLDEVVVVAYGTAKKKDLTGSISTLDTKMVVAQSNSSVSNALEGAVAGIQVSAAEGQPGTDMMIRVRGLGSTNESAANALIVIDGVPQQNTNVLTSINPNDIANMTVLKDAASTALYGSRGANGVVLITTKKGSIGKAKVTFDARWGINTMTNNMPDLVRDPAAIYEHQWLLNYNTYRYSDGKPYQNNGYTNSAATGGNYSHEEAALFASQHLFDYSANSAGLGVNQLGNWMLYSFPGWNEESNYARRGSGTGATATMLNNYLVGTDGKLNPAARLLYNDTYYDNLLENRFRQEYNISASGGSEKVDYHVSLGLLEDPSYIKTSSFNRYTGRVVVNGYLTDWLKVGANVNYTYRKTNGQPANYSDAGIRSGLGDSGLNIFTVVNGQLPIMQLYAHDKDGNYRYNADGSKKVSGAHGDGESWIGPTQSDPWQNIYGDILKKLELDRQTLTSHYVTSRAFADIKFLKDFTFTVNVAVDASFDNITRYLNNETGSYASTLGAFNKQNGSNVNINTQQLLNYNRDFDKHHVDAMIGHEYNQYSYEDMIYTSSYSLIPGFAAYGNFVGVYTGERTTANRFEMPGGNMWKMAMESYLGKANYIYDNKYGLSASLRRDGSSKFKKPEQRWGTFWSVGGSWRLTNEEFMKSTNDWLNNLKIRASYGVIGNQNGLSTYATYQTWLLGANYNATAAGAGWYNEAGYQDSRSQGAGRVPNSFLLRQNAGVYEDLTWENIHTTDVGIDFDLFNRVHATFDWYNRETVNAFYANTLSIAAEAFALTQSLTKNNAKIRNRGFEVDLNVDLIRNKDFFWSVGANGTHFTTILSEMPAGQGSELLNGNQQFGSEYLCYLRGEGKPYYGTYLYHYAGPDPSTGAPLYQHTVTAADVAAGTYTGKQAGDYVNTADVSKITTADRVETGDALPKWIGGFNTTLRYKNLDFSGAIAYQLGGKFFWQDGIYYYESDFGRDHSTPISADLIGNTWTPENPNAKFPIAQTNRSNAFAYGISVVGGPGQSTDLLLFSASYFSLKNITVGYTLPKELTKKAGIGNLRVYASGDNLFMKSAQKGMDPRMSFTGSVGTYVYPYLRVFNVGLNLEF
jgi:TonB-linked SusC/RagA family outer membrane protein